LGGGSFPSIRFVERRKNPIIMAKRGGRGRKRSRQQQQQDSEVPVEDTGDHDQEPHPKKARRRQQQQDQHPPKILVNHVEVSLVHSSSVASHDSIDNELPPALKFDSTTDENQEKKETITTKHSYGSDTDQPSDTEHMLRKVWKYLGNGNPSWNPSPIQQYMWSILLHTQYPTIGVASTGSGKTLAYAIPTLLSSATTSTTTGAGATLVLVPTRELVQQVTKVFSKVVKAYQKQCCSLASSSSSSSREAADTIVIVSIYGGTSRERQRDELETAATSGRSIIIATPGRLLEMYKTSSLLPIFSYIVLDEADQLSKEGDLGLQVDEILQMATCDNRGMTRLILVTATYSEKARTKFHSWIGKSSHVLIQVDRIQQSVSGTLTTDTNDIKPTDEDDPAAGKASNIGNNEIVEDTSVPKSSNRDNSGTYAKIPSHLQQVLHVCSEHKKPRKLLHTLKLVYDQFANHHEQQQQRSRPLGIIFVSKIDKLKHISKLLDKEGYSFVEMHSQLESTQQRSTNLAQFACGKKPILLATDLAARGIDIPSVQFIIQYDFPGNLQQYVHRCGRAGRSYTRGGSTPGTTAPPKPTVYSFFTRNLKAMAADLVQLLQNNNAWVDPNLLALVHEARDGESKEKTQTKTSNNKKKERSSQNSNDVKQSLDRKANDEEDDDDNDVDEFPELSGNRIVLKRASHVSDASSSSSEEDDEE